MHGDKGAICGALAREGLKIFPAPSSQGHFLSYLAGCKVDDRIVIVDRTGWHAIGDGSSFALPSGTIGPAECGQVVLDEGAHGPYATKGTVAGTKDSQFYKKTGNLRGAPEA